MRVEIEAEELVPLGEVRRRLIPRVKGKPIAPSTIWRWIHRGCRAADGTRVHLEVVYVGGRPMASAATVQRFFDELTRRNRAADGAGDEDAEPRRTPATERRLRDAGLL